MLALCRNCLVGGKLFAGPLFLVNWRKLGSKLTFGPISYVLVYKIFPYSNCHVKHDLVIIKILLTFTKQLSGLAHLGSTVQFVLFTSL